MLIRLEYNGRIIHEISSAAIADELVIGRSHTCAWPVPKEDAVASSQHASLFRKGKAVWLKDLGSTNGTFCSGKKILKKKLALNDKISLGNCVLCVEPERGADSKTCSELVVLSGKGRGQKKPLVPPVFTIGSDPNSHLAFLDLLVSRRHAEVAIKEDGSCWIRDLGSKNGTSVNGMPLRDDKERLLKDGDRIAFSHLEVEFHDGAVKHSNKQAWLKIGVIVVTLGVGAGLWWTYQQMRPAWAAFYRVARRLAEQEQFGEAAKELDKAVNARGAAEHTLEIEGLRGSLGAWGNTLSTWRHSQKALEKGDWTQASRDLGELQSSKKESWAWSSKASDEKEMAVQAKDVLDAFLEAENAMRRDDVPLETLSKAHEDVKLALARLSKIVPPYLEPLKAELEKSSGRVSALIGESRGLEEAMNKLKLDPPPYDEIAGVVGLALDSKEKALQQRARALAPAVQALAASYKSLASALQQVRELELDKAMAGDIGLPSIELCALDPRVSQARADLEKAHKKLKGTAGQMRALFAEIEKRIGRAGDMPECVRPFLDAAAVAQALACDSLKQPLPKRSRKEAVGSYDQVLGVEEFYAYLSAFPDSADPGMFTDLPFVSALSRAREAVQKIEAFQAFVQQNKGLLLVGGTMTEQMSRLDAILARRDGIVKEMVAKAESGTGRAGLIAGGIAARLSTKAGRIQIKKLRPEEWVAAELKRQRADLLKLSEEYSRATPTRQIEIRTEILEKGLPGDPVVRGMWAKRDAAASAP